LARSVVVSGMGHLHEARFPGVGADQRGQV
jgi:hypothetical protein